MSLQIMEQNNKCLTNKEINISLKKQGANFRRIGSCTDCNGKCCNFITIGWVHEMSVSTKLYQVAHGAEIIRDKWISKQYLVLPSRCNNNCAKSGKCVVFEGKEFPACCMQFPISPEDSTYRYLVQKGNSCGFKFIDAKTKKSWDMKRTDYWKVQNVKQVKK